MSDNNAYHSSLMEEWLHGRAPHTQRAYRRDVARFLAGLPGPLATATVADVQSFANGLSHLAPASRNRALAATKSFLAYAHEVGAIPKDVGRLVKLATTKETLAERILSRAQVRRMLDGEQDARNHAILSLLYTTGLRVSEVAGLRWRDCVECDGEGGEPTAQITVFGKGGKTRFVQLHPPVWGALTALTPVRGRDARVFAISAQQIRRVVSAAGKRAGIAGQVTPHFLRHSWATHSIEGGMPLHEVQAVLGHASLTTTARYLHTRAKQSSARYLDV